MSTRLVIAGLLVAAGIGTQAGLLACGDKFLIVSRGTRFQRAAVARQNASVLVFANPASNLPKALANVPVEATLRKAGYQATTVTNAADFETALRRGGWDLVLVDVSDSGTIGVSARQGGGPTIVPVVYNITSQELAQVKKQYPAVLKSPTKSQPFLDAIDDALAVRLASSKASHKSGD